MVGLLDRGFSERGVLDLVLAFKALAANRMHHPQLLAQLAEAQGPRKFVALLGGGGGLGEDLQLALLEIVR